jgi:hypothetical protein
MGAESSEWGSDEFDAFAKDRDSMMRSGLYRYPFDKDGDPTLTFGEAIAAARNLELQLNAMMKRWTWPDVTLAIFERRPGYVRYEVRRQGEFVGVATVMPFSTEPTKMESESAAEGKMRERIPRSRSGTDGG